MCGRSAIAEDLGLVRDAGRVADSILGRYLRIPVRKSMDLGTAKGFDRAVVSMAAKLRIVASGNEADAVRAAVSVLDVDWRATTAAQRRTLIAGALEAAGLRARGVPKAVTAVFGPAADEVVGATRDHARRAHGLAIGADFNALDRRIVKHLVKSQANFVRNEYGKRVDGLGEQARRIVAEGLDAGLGRDDIATELERAAKKALVQRSAFYWEVVAGSFIANGRSYANISSFAEAGIERYVIEATLDESTTETCRFLHGKAFSVGGALRRFDRMEALDKPEDIKSEQPWVREATDAETGRKVLYVTKGDTRIPITEVMRSAVGTKDDVGEFARGKGERELMDLGLSFPPYHGLCRTTVLPADAI